MRSVEKLSILLLIARVLTFGGAYTAVFYDYDGDLFDFIIVGAGTAGSVIANRLTENEEFTVLLIEAGNDPPIESQVPSLFTFLFKTKNDWKYYTQNDNYTFQHQQNKVAYLARGKMLGGCSSINNQYYGRGNHHDYNNWAAITNDTNWKWYHVLPYFIKSEKLLDDKILKSPDGVFHGTNGYMKVKKQYVKELDKYYNAFAEVGHDTVLDTEGDRLGYTPSIFNIGDRTRQSSAYSFLSPIKDRPNLFVLKDTLVTKILFDENKNVIGVNADDGDKVRTFMANKEVIVSAGAINSPQLLMLSGIGPKSHLESKYIDIVEDLPVGQSMKDHIAVMLFHKMGKLTPRSVDIYDFPFPAISAFISLDKCAKSYADYQVFSYVINDPNVLIVMCSFYFGIEDAICEEISKETEHNEVLVSIILHLHPESTGNISLHSSDPGAPPLIYPRYYSKDIDLENHIKYVKDYLQVENSTFFQSVNATLIIPEGCNCAGLEDNIFWRCYSLCMMFSGYHFAGTCPMGTVVDSKLKIYGINGVRVADTSIMPSIIRGNTGAPAIMIGERVADIIKEYYMSPSINSCT